MLATAALVRTMLRAPCFCKHFLLGQQGPSVLQAVLPIAAALPLGTDRWQLVHP